MAADEEGFCYPSICKEECIECGACERVCPVHGYTPPPKASPLPAVYEVQLRDDAALKASASGGFFSALCEYAFQQNAVAYGAIYDENFQVVHAKAEDKEESARFRGSKYVQSNLGKCFQEVKSHLLENRLCVFSGTPCQVEGLYQYLGKRYENLITVDLVCAGVPSPKLWRKYLDEQEKRANSKVKYANFRYKTYGYQCSTLRLEFENGKKYSKSGRIDPMMKFFVSGIAKRPICYECPFKGEARSSDFTLFDGWHFKELTQRADNNKGYTAVMVRSQRAQAVFEQLKAYLNVYQVDAQQAIAQDGIMVNGYPHKAAGRDNFYLELSEKGFPFVKEKYAKASLKNKLIERVKPLLYQMGVIHRFKKLKGKFKKKKG